MEMGLGAWAAAASGPQWIEDKRLVRPHHLEALSRWVAETPVIVLDYEADGDQEAALVKVDAATTAARASQLQLARQVDAATGLVLAPQALLGLVGWAGWSWFRYGRDPEYLDDPSVLMPAPPPGLTPAAATGSTSGAPATLLPASSPGGPRRARSCGPASRRSAPPVPRHAP